MLEWSNTINRITSVYVVDGFGEVVAEPETSHGLAEAVDIVVRRHCRCKLDELILKDERGAFGIEENISARPPDDGEAERRFIAPGQLQIVCLASDFGIFVRRRLVQHVARDNVVRPIG